MILSVDPSQLTDTARPLRDVVEVGRQLESVRSELAPQLTGVGSEPVRRATEIFLDAWAVGLRGVSDRAERLVAVLDTAAADYAEVEERLRRRAAAGPEGGPA